MAVISQICEQFSPLSMNGYAMYDGRPVVSRRIAELCCASAFCIHTYTEDGLDVSYMPSEVFDFVE